MCVEHIRDSGTITRSFILPPTPLLFDSECVRAGRVIIVPPLDGGRPDLRALQRLESGAGTTVPSECVRARRRPWWADGPRLCVSDMLGMRPPLAPSGARCGWAVFSLELCSVLVRGLSTRSSTWMPLRLSRGLEGMVGCSALSEHCAPTLGGLVPGGRVLNFLCASGGPSWANLLPSSACPTGWLTPLRRHARSKGSRCRWALLGTPHVALLRHGLHCGGSPSAIYAVLRLGLRHAPSPAFID